MKPSEHFTSLLEDLVATPVAHALIAADAAVDGFHRGRNGAKFTDTPADRHTGEAPAGYKMTYFPELVKGIAGVREGARSVLNTRPGTLKEIGRIASDMGGIALGKIFNVGGPNR